MRSETLTLTPPLTIHAERLADAARALREVLAA
jgi:4-aminobutyrate aminotransferase-like enzyme